MFDENCSATDFSQEFFYPSFCETHYLKTHEINVLLKVDVFQAFHFVTKQRIENVLKLTDPSFLQLLGDQGAFSIRESDRLFGSKFIARMVREAQEDRALRSLAQANRPSGRAMNYGNGFRPQLAGRSSFRLSANRISATIYRQRYVNNVKSNNEGRKILGGRLAGFLRSWEVLTGDPWVLDIIKEGVKLNFVSIPTQSKHPSQIVMSDAMHAVCASEIDALVEKGISIPFCSDGFVSSMFAIPKSSDGYRPNINLKLLNAHIEYKPYCPALPVAELANDKI